MTETGWPTDGERTEDTQARVLTAVAEAVLPSGTGVRAYEWFGLRDGLTTGSWTARFGILRDDYTPKPAFAAIQQLIADQTAQTCPGARLRTDDPPASNLPDIYQNDVSERIRLAASGRRNREMGGEGVSRTRSEDTEAAPAACPPRLWPQQPGTSLSWSGPAWSAPVTTGQAQAAAIASARRLTGP